MKINHKSIVKKGLLLGVPLILVWYSLILYTLKAEQTHVISSLIQQNESQDSNTAFLVDNYMDEIVENLKLIRDADEVQLYLNSPHEAPLSEVEAMFQRVMVNKNDYDQLRLLDSTGNEIVRVDNLSETQVHLTTKDALQFKGNRYYFQETQTLQHNEVFISPLDLNMENGDVEIPYKPVVRFATPLFNQNNVFQGILIINYKAEYFITLLEEHKAHEGLDNYWFYIVNKNGEFILHHDENNNFSYMFKETNHLNFSLVNQSAWDTIKKGDMGTIKTDKTLITFYDLLQKTRLEHPNYTERWIAVHDMDITTLFSFSRFFEEITHPGNLLVLIAIILFATAYAFLKEKSDRKDQRLELTELIASSTSDGVMITDGQTRITYVNKSYLDITGYQRAELIGMKPNDFKSDKQDEAFYQQMWREINTNGYWEGMLWNKKKNGMLYPLKMKIISVRNKNTKSPQQYISIFNDIASQSSEMKRLRQLSVSNNNFLIPNEEMMIQLLKQSMQDKEFSFMVLYISIENYNQLLTSFNNFEAKSAELFIEIVKPLLHKEDFVAQTGRNVFTLIVGMQHLETEAHHFVSDVHKSLSKIIKVDEREFFFKTRMGVSFWPYDTDDLKRLLLNSIIALEWSSHRTSSEIAFFREEMIHELNQENEIESYMRNAIANNELYIVYQPQIDTSQGKVVGVEALLRWTNPKLGAVSPALFIPIAERSHLIIDIGYWVIKQVCSDLIEMMQASPEKMAPVRCAINLSALQIHEGAFLDNLLDIITNRQVPFVNLEIEITESLLLSNERKSIEILNAMREVGLTVAIDDFGTGYSSLSYLNTLPIDKIKIDRSFIKGYPINDNGKLAKILIGMSKSLGIDVLAEGAESLEQIKFLSDVGCHLVQGFYYSKPIEKDAFIEYLEKHNCN